MAVIKANAYGHGMREVAMALQPMVPAFAVALIEEAVLLRDAGITRPILILQGVNDAADVREAAASEFWLLLHRQQQLDEILPAKLQKPLGVWLKLDTGMHRFGLAPEKLGQVCEQLRSSPNIRQNLVLCTHLACADDLDNPMTARQVSLARSYANMHKLDLSIANSVEQTWIYAIWPVSHRGLWQWCAATASGNDHVFGNFRHPEPEAG
jgi:alanine racemase